MKKLQFSISISLYLGNGTIGPYLQSYTVLDSVISNDLE